MLRIFRHIRKFLLSALKRYSPGRLLQYLLALCRAVFSRSKSKCSGQDSSHESLPKTPALAEGKESLAEEGIAVGHVISGSRTPAQVEAGLAHIEEIPLLTRNDQSESPLRHDVCIKSELSLKKSFRCTWTNLAGLLSKVFFLDQDGFIERSLAHTQIKDERSPADTRDQDQKVWYTDVEKWRKFSRTYAKDTQQISLLATVLLTANMSFLAIQSVDTAPGGLLYIPQVLSYTSLFAALCSIVMGLVVRSPRLFINHGPVYFQRMTFILAGPFIFFMYSLVLFLHAILTHCSNQNAVPQLVIGGVFAVFLSYFISLYWLITEPCNDIDSLEHCFVTVTRESRAATTT